MRVHYRYRLAPEYPYPVPFKDYFDATVYFLEHASEYDVDSKRVAIAGNFILNILKFQNTE